MSPLPVITGLGFVTSIGHERAAVLDSLRRLRHGFERVEFFGNPDLSVKVAGTLKGFSFPTPNWRDWRWPDRFTVDRELLRGLAPHGVYALCALQQALAEAGLQRSDLIDSQTGLFCASAGSPFLLGAFLRQLQDSRPAQVRPAPEPKGRGEGERGRPADPVGQVPGHRERLPDTDGGIQGGFPPAPGRSGDGQGRPGGDADPAL
jgi:3-oxoacyl-(acyl-carrier-protein) synthase